MKIPQDERFREEWAAFDLRWNCEDCANFDSVRGCAHGYPTHRHRRSRYDESTAELFFCKDFELA